ncbi:MAG TPA: GyrI-like domain-containing protein [Micromonosporaceae bacterium]|nr:GyrI-like domain-containing protein [Micromonosporaceae bacterium]
MDLPHPPEIVNRGDESYVGMRRTITMDGFAELTARIPELFSWLAGRHIEAAGAPFFRLNVIDMGRQLECETGIPVADPAFDEAVSDQSLVFDGVLPAGRYVSYLHAGHPAQLVDVTTAVLAWADNQGLSCDVTPSADGDRWGCRLIVNLSDPDREPDMSRWQTSLLFRLAD